MDKKIKFYYFLYFFALSLFLITSFSNYKSVYQISKLIHDANPSAHLLSFNKPFKGFDSNFKKARKFINKSGDLFALDDKGKVVWKYLLNEKNKILKNPYIYKDFVFFVSQGGFSYLLDLKGSLIYASKSSYSNRAFIIDKDHAYISGESYLKHFVIKRDILSSHILWKSLYFEEKNFDFMILDSKSKQLYIEKKNELIKVLDTQTGKILNNTYF